MATLLSNQTEVYHMENEWFVVQTWLNSEKIVSCELNKKNFEVFLPLTETLNIWKNRQRKIIVKALFPGYLFVKTERNELYKLRWIPKIIQTVCCAGEPSVVPVKVIEGIMSLVQSGQQVQCEPTFSEGQRVRIVEGPLVGQEGILIEKKGKTRFGIQVKEINQTAHIEICTSVLEKL